MDGAPRRREDAFSPWADRDHPDADEDTDARYKWGLSENYVDGERVGMAEVDPQLDGRVFIQQDSDPFAFVDGDDVRCPETGAVHPEFVDILQALGATYTDVSTSGAGVHAYYEGALPNDQGQAVFEIDTEPWGENDDPPTVEIYANKHVCVTTGDHVAGTPETVAQWDADAVKTILDENDALKQSGPVSHDTDRDRPDLDDHTPTATGSDETTDDVRDVLKAVDRLRPSDLHLRSRRVGSDSTGWEQWDPSSYRSSSGNDSLHRPAGEPVFHDHKHAESFGVLSLLAAEENIISKPWDRLAGADWWEAVEKARDHGAPIPEYVGPKTEDTDQVAVLPESDRIKTATTGWDWKHAGSNDDTLSVEDARERTVEAIADAYQRYEHTLIEALPTMGKSYGAVKAAAETGEPVTILTGRGQKEQYQQFEDWCDDHGLDYKRLPSFTHDCPAANSDHGEDWRETVMDWYRRGATPQQIHNQAEYVLDRPLPCQVAEDGTHIDCEYRHAWNFTADDYDVLIGHYTHAYTEQPVEGRTVVFDEFPGDYERGLTTMQSAISCWLSTVDAVPFDNYTDLVENRDDQRRRGQALLWFEEHGVEPDEDHVFDDAKAHADAPLAVFTLLAADDLGNGFETADLGDTGTSVFNRETTEVSVLRPPPGAGIRQRCGRPRRDAHETDVGPHTRVHRPRPTHSPPGAARGRRRRRTRRVHP